MKQIYYIIPPPATKCGHKEKRVDSNQTICKKCGRIRTILDNKTTFAYCNKVVYQTYQKVMKGGQEND